LTACSFIPIAKDQSSDAAGNWREIARSVVQPQTITCDDDEDGIVLIEVFATYKPHVHYILLRRARMGVRCPMGHRRNKTPSIKRRLVRLKPTRQKQLPQCRSTHCPINGTGSPTYTRAKRCLWMSLTTRAPTHLVHCKWQPQGTSLASSGVSSPTRLDLRPHTLFTPSSLEKGSVWMYMATIRPSRTWRLLGIIRGRFGR
jgi:hypothetical protein